MTRVEDLAVITGAGKSRIGRRLHEDPWKLTADATLAAGDTAGAAELYSEVLAGDPANLHALAGLARSHVQAGSIEEAKEILAQVPEAKRNDTAVAAARAALEVAEQAAHIGPVTELEQKVAPTRSTIRRDSTLPLR